jgi:hypothetical protein
VRETGSADWADYIFYGDPTLVLKVPATADQQPPHKAWKIDRCWRKAVPTETRAGLATSSTSLARYSTCRRVSRSLGTEMTLACAIPLATASALHAQTSSRVSARAFNAAHPDRRARVDGLGVRRTRDLGVGVGTALRGDVPQ